MTFAEGLTLLSFSPPDYSTARQLCGIVPLNFIILQYITGTGSRKNNLFGDLCGVEWRRWTAAPWAGEFNKKLSVVSTLCWLVQKRMGSNGKVFTRRSVMHPVINGSFTVHENKRIRSPSIEGIRIKLGQQSARFCFPERVPCWYSSRAFVSRFCYPPKAENAIQDTGRFSRLVSFPSILLIDQIKKFNL